MQHTHVHTHTHRLNLNSNSNSIRLDSLQWHNIIYRQHDLLACLATFHLAILIFCAHNFILNECRSLYHYYSMYIVFSLLLLPALSFLLLLLSLVFSIFRSLCECVGFRWMSSETQEVIWSVSHATNNNNNNIKRGRRWSRRRKEKKLNFLLSVARRKYLFYVNLHVCVCVCAFASVLVSIQRKNCFDFSDNDNNNNNKIYHDQRKRIK